MEKLYFKNKYLKYKQKYYKLYIMLNKNNYRIIKGGMLSTTRDCPYAAATDSIVHTARLMTIMKIEDTNLGNINIEDCHMDSIKDILKSYNCYLYKDDISANTHTHLRNYTIIFENLLKKFLQINMGTGVTCNYPRIPSINYEHSKNKKLLDDYNIKISLQDSEFCLTKKNSICNTSEILVNTCGNCGYISSQMFIYFSDLFRRQFTSIYRMDCSQKLISDKVKLFLPLKYLAGTDNIDETNERYEKVYDFFNSIVIEYKLILEIFNKNVEFNLVEFKRLQIEQIRNFCNIYNITIINDDCGMDPNTIILYINLILLFFMDKYCSIKILKTNELTKSDIDNINFLGLIFETSDHASSLYKCNNKLVYFNNGSLDNNVDESTILSPKKYIFTKNEHNIRKLQTSDDEPWFPIIWIHLLNISDTLDEDTYKDRIYQIDHQLIMISFDNNIIIKILTTYSKIKMLQLINECYFYDVLKNKIMIFCNPGGILCKYNVVSSMIVYYILENFNIADLELFNTYFGNNIFVQILKEVIKQYIHCLFNIPIENLHSLITFVQDADIRYEIKETLRINGIN